MSENIQLVVTTEQIAKHYSAALDSVNLINWLIAKPERTPEEINTVERNVQHLEIMVTKSYWSVEDLTPLTTAILSGQAVGN